MVNGAKSNWAPVLYIPIRSWGIKTGVSVKSYYDSMKNMNVCNSNNDYENINFDLEDFPQSSDINNPISINEIKVCAKKLANGKSNGLDQIVNEHIKSALHLMLPLYHKLFNLVFDTGVILHFYMQMTQL